MYNYKEMKPEVLSYVGGGHAVVCFPTTQGLIYIEPQTDSIIMDIAHFDKQAQSVSRILTLGDEG